MNHMTKQCAGDLGLVGCRGWGELRAKKVIWLSPILENTVLKLSLDRSLGIGLWHQAERLKTGSSQKGLIEEKKNLLHFENTNTFIGDSKK